MLHRLLAACLSVPWTRIETAKRAFCVAPPNVWNSLPNDIRNASSLFTFPAKLTTHFKPARRYASAGLCDKNVSVRPSVTSRYCVKTKKATRSVMISSPAGSPTILVFWCQISSQNSKGVTPSEGVKQGMGGEKQAIF